MNPLEEYLEDHTSDEDSLMAEVNRRTHLTTYYPRMLSGRVQGKFLEMIAHMLRPQRILEIGSFTGYSALALAKGLDSGGELITIEINDELEKVLRDHFSRSPRSAQIRLIIGNALQVIPTLEGLFDLVFIDADKEQYPDYYELALDKTRPGGFILIDNVLWGGKVVNAASGTDKETTSIRNLNDHIAKDPRVEQVMLGIRDGLYLIRRLP